jgi:hypothetical protein
MKAGKKNCDFHCSHNLPLVLDHCDSKVLARFVAVSTFPQRSSQQQGSFRVPYLEKSCYEDGENPCAVVAPGSSVHFHTSFGLFIFTSLRENE